MFETVGSVQHHWVDGSVLHLMEMVIIMRTLSPSIIIVLLCVVSIPCISKAADTTLQWNPNAAIDGVDVYTVYLCSGFTNCTVILSDAVATVNSSDTATAYTWPLPPNMVGNVAVSASNQYGMSPLSVQVPFNSFASGSPPVPAAPTGLTVVSTTVNPPIFTSTTLLNSVTTAQASPKLSLVSNGTSAKSVTLTITGTWVGKLHFHWFDVNGSQNALSCNGFPDASSSGTVICTIPSGAVTMNVELISITSGSVTVAALAS